MESSITNAVLEASVLCPYKAYLKHAVYSGTLSEYEAVLQDLRSEVKAKVTRRILTQSPERAVVTGQPVTTAMLKCGPLFVLDAFIEDGQVSITLDGLKQVPGASSLGSFLYLSIVFHEAQHVHKEQRLLLALCIAPCFSLLIRIGIDGIPHLQCLTLRIAWQQNVRIMNIR